MIHSAYNGSNAKSINYQTDNYTNKQKAPIDNVKSNENANFQKVPEQQSTNKVEQIKSQIANGSYKMLDSNTLAKKLVDAEF